MDAKFEEVVIAAWLHDVGKFAQRVDVAELFNKSVESVYCKLHKGGYYTHQHVVYTQGFLEKYKDVLPDGLNIKNIIDLASFHHSPSTAEQWLISEADCLSSGADRCNVLKLEEAESDKEENRHQDETKLKFYEKPMKHLISSISIGDRKENIAYYKMQKLSNDSVLASTSEKISKEDYKNLWVQFEKDFQKLKGSKYEDFILALDSLLEQYWWCIPSATNDDVDISLYQHAKTTAAFAAALYRFHENDENLSEVEIRKVDVNKFLFVNGDISGIQKYIFDLKTTKDSSKLLRAKSFQLWALSEVLSQYIVKKYDLTPANVIMSAGGKFIVLLQNSKEAKKKLADLQTEIEEYFLKEFAGHLAVIISDGVEANATDLQKKNAQNLFNKIGEEADKAKQKKMQKALSKLGYIRNENYEALQRNGLCPKCGVFAARENGLECANCEKLTEIGARLVKGKSIIFNIGSDLKHFGDMVKISGKEDYGYSINEFIPGRPLVHLPYVAPKYEDGELLTFEDIAGKSTGNRKLAMFKSDIDNLGLVFSSGLKERVSLSRYADLSKMLHYFFSAFYAWFVENHSDKNGNIYKDTVYTVFSGGDDLCVLGAWDSVMQFAFDFKKELDKFTNNNPSVTLSGGISLVSSNIPVGTIADMTEELLEKSKSHKENNIIVKNAITVFDRTVSWQDYGRLLDEGRQLQDYLEAENLSTGVVYKMIDFSNRASKIGNGNVSELLNMSKKDLNGHLRDNLWKSNMHYLIARNVKEEGIKHRLLEVASDSELMRKYCIAVSYALYTQRGN
ncbi:MAG: type III-A CRISPR-associated protein Cas10/Csm1 [Treponema sp.]|nr:type III-A CRISPR-associated protein Cas10/Csm1 [Treponema sp.]